MNVGKIHCEQSLSERFVIGYCVKKGEAEIFATTLRQELTEILYVIYLKYVSLVLYDCVFIADLFCTRLGITKTLSKRLVHYFIYLHIRNRAQIPICCYVGVGERTPHWGDSFRKAHW